MSTSSEELFYKNRRTLTNEHLASDYPQVDDRQTFMSKEDRQRASGNLSKSMKFKQ